MVENTKYTLEYGETVAQKLWNAFEGFGVSFEGAKVFDFGCHWGYFCRHILKAGKAAQADGFDIMSHWDMVEEADVRDLPGLRLFSGELETVPEIQAERYDVIVTAGTLFLLPPEVLERTLRWFYDHLKPGGHLLARTRTVFSHVGGDLHARNIRSEAAHLLFPRRVIDQYLAQRNEYTAPTNLPYCAATWLMIYRCAGFEIEQVVRNTTGLDEAVYERHADRFHWYDEQELHTGEVLAKLRRPLEDPDLQSICVIGKQA